MVWQQVASLCCWRQWVPDAANNQKTRGQQHNILKSLAKKERKSTTTVQQQSGQEPQEEPGFYAAADWRWCWPGELMTDAEQVSGV